MIIRARIVFALAAATAMQALAADPFVERTALLAKAGKAGGAQAAAVIGVFPGTTSGDLTNSYSVLRRYLPLANYLTAESGVLVSLVPERNVNLFKERVASKRYEVVYVNAEIGATAAFAGYEPIVRRAEPIVSAILTRADSKAASLKDFDAKSIAMVDQAMVSTIAKAALHKEGLWERVRLIKAGSTGTADLVALLDAQTADGVVMREENAKQIVASKPKAYKVAVITGQAPGFLLMARRDGVLTPGQVDRIGKAFLGLDPGTESEAAVMRGLDGVASAYQPASRADIAPMVEMLTTMSKIDPSGNHIVRAKSASTGGTAPAAKGAKS